MAARRPPFSPPTAPRPSQRATPRSYASAPPAAEDYAKEPPPLPPHLQLTLLNVAPADGGAGLPRPQHVVLGHAYLQRGQNANALVVGTSTATRAST